MTKNLNQVLAARSQDKQRELHQKMSKELATQMSEKRFPAANIPEGFGEWLYTALKHESQKSLQCPWHVFKSLLQKSLAPCAPEKDIVLTIEEMGFSLNCIESKTPAQWQNGYDYIAVQQCVYDMAQTWNVLVNEIKTEIEVANGVKKPSSVATA